MTLPPRPASIALPFSALLPPSDQAGPSKHHHFPTPAAALLGPLPTTSPFHLALSYLELQDIPAYESIPSDERSGGGSRKGKEREAPNRVLIITSSKDMVYKLLEEEDEEWMREYGGSYGVLERLKRIDIRYCPTAAHLKLLLTLLSTDSSRTPKDPQTLIQAPSLIIAWDMGSLLMEDVESNAENVPPEDETLDAGDVDMNENGENEGTVRLEDEKSAPHRRLRASTTISSYLDLISSLRSAVDHFSGLHPSAAPPQLIILEPSLSPDASLPIMPAQPGPATPSQRASKRVQIADGLRWMFGPHSVGFITPDRESDDGPGETSYSLNWRAEDEEADIALRMVRRPCGKSPHLGPPRVDVQGNPEIAAWQWHWSS